MRVTVYFTTNDQPSVQVQLSGAPASGDVLNLNGLSYRVDTVVWNANPAPMRADDLQILVTPEEGS